MRGESSGRAAATVVRQLDHASRCDSFISVVESLDLREGDHPSEVSEGAAIPERPCRARDACTHGCTTVNEFTLGCEMHLTTDRLSLDPRSVPRLSDFPAWAVFIFAMSGTKPLRYR